MAETPEVLTAKNGRIATTETPPRTNPRAETARRNLRKTVRAPKRK